MRIVTPIVIVALLVGACGNESATPRTGATATASATVSPASAPTSTTPPPTAIPTVAPVSVRPFTGLLRANAGPVGPGELTVKNGTDADGVVVVALQNNQTVMSAYVRTGESFRFAGIADGTYLLFFTKGQNWDVNTRRFTTNQTFNRFTDVFPFATTATTTDAWTVTLYGVAGGNAGSQTVDPGSFPSV